MLFIDRPGLKITRPSLLPLLFIGLSILFLLITLEVCTYNPRVVSVFPFPSPAYDSNFPEIDVKLKRLWLAGSVDCMVFGSSITDAGLNPTILEKVIAEKSGKNFTCFNMGIGGSMLETSGALANTVSHWYPLKLVIIGISPFDMDSVIVETRVIAKMPVFEYYNGKFTLAGWLFNHFNLPWYFAAIEKFSNQDYQNGLSEFDYLLDPRGLRRSYENSKVFIEDQEVQYDNFSINPVDMSAMVRMITNLKNQGITVVLVEMPVRPSFFPNIISGGEKKYQQVFLGPLQEKLIELDVTFIRTQPSADEILNIYDWTNRNHLNFVGSQKFTTFVGNQLVAKAKKHR